MEQILKTTGLCVGYNSIPVLSGIGIDLFGGELAVLIGANGSGKSTLLRCLAGIDKPIGGTVEIAGTVPHDLTPRKLARKLAVVFTERAGGGAMTVRESVALGRYPYIGALGRLSKGDKEIVKRVIADVGMADKAERYLATLSDGERQKAMIARALAQDTPLILLDEPTAFLDVAGRLDIMRLLRRLADAGHSIILSTHDIAPAVAVADRLLIVDKEQKKLLSGLRSDIIGSGAIDKAFAASGLHFDPVKGDYTV